MYTFYPANLAESTELREGLSWLREFFRKEAAESKVEEEHRETAQDAPLDSEQREIGVKRCDLS